MIMLTTPPQINTVLGGSSLVAYEKQTISSFTLDPVAQTVHATMRLTSTSVPTMDPLTGSLVILVSTGVLVVNIPSLNFMRRVVLTGPQIASVNTIISNAQNALESGLVSLGVVAGTQSPGI